MVYKEPSPQANCVRVTFELPASLWADRVYLVGDFNQWNPIVHPLCRTHNGTWRITLDLPIGRRYEFRYLIDGAWSTDLHADGCVRRGAQALNSLVDAVLPLENLDEYTAHGMVHEAAVGQQMHAATRTEPPGV